MISPVSVPLKSKRKWGLIGLPGLKTVIEVISSSSRSEKSFSDALSHYHLPKEL